MPGIHDPWLFAATVLVLNATPGVDLVLTLTRTLQHGVRGGLATALGISSGCVLHALGAAFGLAALLAASALAFTVVKWAGAAYLLWLALGMLSAALRPAAQAVRTDAVDNATAKGSMRPPVDARADVGAAPAPTGWQLYRQGVLTNALNPKVALFFLALLPQFIDGDAPHKTLAFLFLGAWFVVQGTTFLVAFVLLVATLRRWRPPAKVERTIQGIGGTLFIALAAKLALAPRP
jgi:threonine/homoserine/homoserine lactone efflux protein